MTMRMPDGRLLLPLLALLTGCAESGPSLEYSALVAEPPDFQPNANPAYHYPEPEHVAADVDVVRPVVDLPDAATEPSSDAAAAGGADGGSQPNAKGQVNHDARNPTAMSGGSEMDANAVSPETAATEDPAATDNPTADASVAADTAAEPVLADAAESGEPREIRVLIPDKRFREEGEGVVRVSYDDIDLLKVLNMEPVPVDAPRHFPAWLKALDGQRIRIRGFMYPTFEATGLRYFTLARDNGICCFVRQPLIYDVIGVDLADGVTTDYIDNKPFDVEGVFRILPEADDTELYQLYRIDDARVVK